jgi:hypothetical protein
MFSGGEIMFRKKSEKKNLSLSDQLLKNLEDDLAFNNFEEDYENIRNNLKKRLEEGNLF